MLVRLQLTFYPHTFQFEFSFQLEMLHKCFYFTETNVLIFPIYFC